jgi:hypothetical protein
LLPLPPNTHTHTHTKPLLGLAPGFRGGLGLAQQPDINSCEMLPKLGGKKKQKAEDPKTSEKQSN